MMCPQRIATRAWTRLSTGAYVVAAIVVHFAVADAVAVVISLPHTATALMVPVVLADA